MSEHYILDVGPIKLYSPIHEVYSNNFDNYFTCYYRKNSESLLNSLCDKHGSDKGEISQTGHPYPWASHTYADFIERTFDHCRHHVKRVFECGIGTNNPTLASSMGSNGRPGASLRVWRDYFPSAMIVGADIDQDVLFQEDRISTFHCDQTQPEMISQMWTDVDVPEFDLMIDDGLHTFQAGMCLFENSFHKLREGGIYIIEDVSVASLLEFKNYFVTKAYRYEFVNMFRKNISLGDNSLIVIRK